MPVPVILVPSPNNGSLTFHLDSLASTNPSLVKAGTGTLVGWFIGNTNAAARYLAFHDTASQPQAGQGIWWKMTLPASAAANEFPPGGIQFFKGLAITTVTNPADSDATAVAAHDLIINLFYV